MLSSRMVLVWSGVHDSLVCRFRSGWETMTLAATFFEFVLLRATAIFCSVADLALRNELGRTSTRPFPRFRSQERFMATGSTILRVLTVANPRRTQAFSSKLMT